VHDKVETNSAHVRVVECQPIVGNEIAPIGDNVSPQLLSVVLPVYQPNHFLADALQSVLGQDMGESTMQIAVVDDASPSRDVLSILNEVDPTGRVELYRITKNQGLAGSWNQCIRIARGEVVHILHQDDWVDDGFYRRLLPAFARPAVGMAFCRHAIATSRDNIVRVSHREAWRAGVRSNWLKKIAERQRIQCAATLVRRSIYEQWGGYRSDLCYALDWEMWVRIAAHFDVWYEPRMLAFYRRHAESETERLSKSSQLDLDVLKTIEIFSEHLPADRKDRMVCSAYERFARRSLKQLKKNAVTTVSMADQLAQLRIAADKMGKASSCARSATQQIAELDRHWQRIAR
jgi:glycosyltransferase involved in cell wall biosynthesis